MKYTVEVILTEKEIKKRISELGYQISEKYKNTDMVIVGLLRGSFIFIADLCRAIKIPHRIDFLTVSSYGSSMTPTSKAKVLTHLNESIYQKDVLLVEDIIDSGSTLLEIQYLLNQYQPKSLSICALLDKKSRRKVNVKVDYIGFSIPDAFVVGYGIDYAQHYRNLPYIGKLVF